MNIVMSTSNWKNYLLTFVVGVILAVSTLVFAQEGNDMNATVQGDYAEVNGLNMYYEIHGTGEPLVLIHGGLGTIGMFGDVLPMLAEHHQVIAVELQGHGRTADIDRPLSYDAMADDVAALIEHLGFERADVMGDSLGADVALRTAIQHPEVVRKLILVSTAFSKNGWFPEINAAEATMNAETAEAMKQLPLYELYASTAPKPEDWPVLVTKLGNLVTQDYDWSEDVKMMTAPTLLVYGDADAIYTSHMAAFYELLGGGLKDAGWDGSGMSKARLAILPGLTHYTIFSSPELARTVIPFLDAPMPD